MTKHALPRYDSCEQKRYLPRHLIKSSSEELHIFIRRLKELNAFLGEFPPDAPRQETAPLPKSILCIIPSQLDKKNKMIERGFNYVDSCFKNITLKIRVENLEPKKNKKKSFSPSKIKSVRKKKTKMRKRNETNSNIVKLGDKSSISYKSVFMRYCEIQGKYNPTIDKLQ